jgi:hypothetical protein
MSLTFKQLLVFSFLLIGLLKESVNALEDIEYSCKYMLKTMMFKVFWILWLIPMMKEK